MDLDRRFWSGKQVCVTGGSGFLGYHLVRKLLSKGATVRVVSLPPRPGHPLHRQTAVQTFYGDLCDRELVLRAVADCDVIFHTAGLIAVWGPALQRMYDVHLKGTQNVLAAAPRWARIIHTSSIVAIGASPTPLPLTEEQPFNLTDLRVDYVQAKRSAELLALEAADRGQDVVVTNPGYLIGPRDHDHSVMGRFCERFWKGRVLLVPPGGFNLVDVRDAARGHLLAAEKGQTGRRYILGGENYNLADFTKLLAEVGQLRPRALPRLPLWGCHLLAALAEPLAWLRGKEPYPARQHVRLSQYYWFCRSDRAHRELGYRARPVEKSLLETYLWLLERDQLSLRPLNRWWMRPTQTAVADRVSRLAGRSSAGKQTSASVSANAKPVSRSAQTSLPP